MSKRSRGTTRSTAKATPVGDEPVDDLVDEAPVDGQPADDAPPEGDVDTGSGADATAAVDPGAGDDAADDSGAGEQPADVPAGGGADADAAATVGPTRRRRDRLPVARTVAKRSIWSRLYHGETNVNFVNRRRVWFAISSAAVLVSLVSLGIRGLNLGIDFEGGVVWEVPAGEASVAEARDAVDGFGLGAATIQELDSDEGREIRVESEPIDAADSDQVTRALAELTGSSTDEVNLTEVGPSWGREISEKAVRALLVFLVLVTIYIALRFELKMAIPTLVALVHDVIITVGVYSITGLEVTPATVIAVLTILGYSIYDGIVVFDKVDENTRLVSTTGGLTYGGMVNVSLNQALMRSLNTTVTALLPVSSLLIVGSWIMGASVLEEFALALLIGLFSGAYSSLFIASPLLAVLKEREPRYRDIRRRVEARGGDAEVVAATVAAGRAPVSRPAPAGSRPGGTVAPSGRAIPPRPRKKTKGSRR
ncbi:MAG TPA: protein translocase subunit SecF [Acidimicrobiales bacterium]|nr:protein translocase subunit SecF [Acidimicrobiales bacterium]